MPESHKKRKFNDRIRDKFLLTVRNEDTFEEKYRFKLSLINLYAVLAGLFVLIGFIFMSLLIMTPLKRLIPGYGVIEDQTAFIELKNNLKHLEEEVRVKNTYIESVQRMLTNDVESVQDAMAKDKPTEKASNKIEKIEEDAIIRGLFDKQINSKKEGIKIHNEEENESSNIYLIAPIKGTISAKFQPHIDHFGIDITAPKNTPIKAILNGFIINADWTIKTGHTIGIQHENNLISFYKHNSLLLKKVGEEVKSGEAIAIIGNSGTLTDGPHLHFELWRNGKPVDPQSFIQFN